MSTPNPQVDEPPSDRYRIIRQLQKTLFGAVFLGWDRDTHSRVAIKRSDLHQIAKRSVTLSGQVLLENPKQEADILFHLNEKLPGGLGFIKVNDLLPLPCQKNVFFGAKIHERIENEDYTWTILEFAQG